MEVVASSPTQGPVRADRLRSLQTLGIFCGFAAGAWLGGAEAPIKLVNPNISPVTISFVMVLGVFLARWSVPAFIRGSAHLRSDLRQAPHLIVWAILGGCMWAVANTLTIYAIRNVGLSIAFPLWNANSLLAIFWGFVLFKELHNAGWKRWLGVLGGALCMFGGATLLAIASSHQAAPGKATLGVLAALGAGILWGTMYIPYRKAYLTGMNPLSFITFFTIGELLTMTLLAVGYRGAVPLWHELSDARSVLFWLMLGGFAAEREGQRYGIEAGYVRAGMEGRAYESAPARRSVLDWILILGTTTLFVALAFLAKSPQVEISIAWAIGLSVAMLALLATCGLALYRVTRFR